MTATTGPSVVAVGGGHGLSRTLRALRDLVVSPAAVVTVADDGGSSGRLRREHDIIALGDIRMALLSLADPADPLGRVMAHRFTRGDLADHALGNLLLLALVEESGDVELALSQAADLLGCRGPVWPCTTVPVTLLASVDGATIAGQVAVATAGGRCRTVWLEPTAPPPSERAMEALSAADLVLLGPGSLYTSIIPNLLVPGIAEAIGAGGSRVLYLANLACQPGETEGMDAGAHVGALLEHLPGEVTLEVLQHHGVDVPGAAQLSSPPPVGGRVTAVHLADLAERGPEGPIAAHDSDRVATALARVLGLRRR